MTPPRPVAASLALEHLLAGPTRPLHVLAAFPAATYLATTDDVVALVAADGVVHPNALVDPRPTGAAPFAGLRPAVAGRIGGGRVCLPDRELQVARWFEPVPRLPGVVAADLQAAVWRAAAHADAVAGPTPDELAAPLAALVDALADPLVDPVVPTRRLLGLGPGLTPSGDDVLAGLLAAVAVVHRAVHGAAGPPGLAGRVAALGEAVAARARGATTTVSAALLAHAVRGATCAPAGDLLRALAGRGELHAALDRLLAVGATSGRDLAVGLLAGTQLVLDDASRTVPVPSTHRPRNT